MTRYEFYRHSGGTSAKVYRGQDVIDIIPLGAPEKNYSDTLPLPMVVSDETEYNQLMQEEFFCRWHEEAQELGLTEQDMTNTFGEETTQAYRRWLGEPTIIEQSLEVGL